MQGKYCSKRARLAQRRRLHSGKRLTAAENYILAAPTFGPMSPAAALRALASAFALTPRDQALVAETLARIASGAMDDARLGTIVIKPGGPGMLTIHRVPGHLALTGSR